MNRYERVKEHLDRLDLRSLRFCTAKGGCACMGCVGSVNGGQVREHELCKYVMATLIPGQEQREDIKRREREGLNAFDDRAGYVLQAAIIKNGSVWGTYLHRSPGHPNPTPEIQLTGNINKGLRILTYRFKP